MSLEIVDSCVDCDVCYQCGRGRERVRVCDCCGDEIYEPVYYQRDGKDFCSDCFLENNPDYDKTITLENALIYGDDEKACVELNGLFAGLGSDKIECLCIEHIKTLSAVEQQDLINDLIEYDKWDWIDVLNKHGVKAAEEIMSCEVSNDD